MATLTCKVPDEMAKRLATVARREKRSKSAVLRDALADRLERKTPAAKKAKTPEAKGSMWDRIKHLSGSIKGGPSDLSTNPKYLEGFGK